jgi:hypothetical protein
MTTICPFAFAAVTQSIGQMQCTQKLADNDPDRSRNVPALYPERTCAVSGTYPERIRAAAEQQPEHSRT